MSITASVNCGKNIDQSNEAVVETKPYITSDWVELDNNVDTYSNKLVQNALGCHARVKDPELRLDC